MSNTESNCDSLEWALIDGRWCMAERGEDVALVMFYQPRMTVEWWLEWFGWHGDVMLYYRPPWDAVEAREGET